MSSSQTAARYFQPRKGDFWEWSNVDQVITWIDGQTICYAQDLMDILKSLQPQGLPPLETVILLIAACRQEWHTIDFPNLDALAAKGAVENEETELVLAGALDSHRLTKQADFDINLLPCLNLLKRIHALPEELRTGSMRVHLIKRIFSHYTPFITPVVASIYIKEFESGALRKVVLNIKRSNKSQFQDIHAVFSPLFGIEDLETYVRVGLEKVPEPTPVPNPDTEPDDLLTQLSKQQQTAGLARLTKRLIAALNIPPHTHGASDQPLGGVSDLSNRGDFDRLLISELANDDDTLSARLVNNEALYLRRETPPDPQVQERVILVDVSLRLWGIPKVFAVSVALGIALNNTHHASIAAYALGQKTIGPSALSSKAEVVTFLEKIDPALHCAEGLKIHFRQHPKTASKAIFFITSEDALLDKNFSQHLNELATELDYVLVVSRTGTLLFYKMVNGHRRLLSTSVFDLKELLFGTIQSALPSELVEELNLKTEPWISHSGLFLPAFPGRLMREEVAFDGTVLVAVLPCKRVWFWQSAQKGAIEVLRNIEDGGYTFYLAENELKCIIVKTKEHKFIAYLFKDNKLFAVVDLHAKLIRYHPRQNVVKLPEMEGQVVACGYEGGNLFIGLNHPASPNYYYHHKNITHVIELNTHTISPLPEKRFIPKEHSPLTMHPIKKMVHCGYSVLRNIKEIGFTPEGFIQLDQHRIVSVDGKLWLVKTLKDNITMRKFEPETRPAAQFYTRSVTWQNGSKITLDSRGFLQLFRPASPTAEFTITLIIGQPLAAFSRSGAYTGNPYFYDVSPDKITSPSHFYKTIIVEFIKKLD
ncbi:hypothetical protein [Haliscomenobacter hydrossis]|uniref:Uncharacterized protein n=1 Tax=Haliscomenobacter hydrossis (strain ATCC 27775 / DSM 1100 / LMG 10767 / O) TaxID=760192 RepID=F4L0C9_HALH1|nr:hypothetical protein [Haliscomenobacter hydrossis]AEE53802.1 hypothetical protein Halhy_5979 [Haliscomenobacter hydrossis DSM 1100]